LGIFIAVATIIPTVILSQGFMKIKTSEAIKITGSAEKEQGIKKSNKKLRSHKWHKRG